jgi:hypothetical protein
MQHSRMWRNANPQRESADRLPLFFQKEEIMFQFNYKLKVAERVKAKCERHPRYNPEREGRGGIKGGCSTCFSLFDLHQARLSLDVAHHEFLRRALPWAKIHPPRTQ